LFQFFCSLKNNKDLFIFRKIITSNKPMEYSKPANPRIKNEFENKVKSSFIAPVISV